MRKTNFTELIITKKFLNSFEFSAKFLNALQGTAILLEDLKWMNLLFT
jgi:hypothetical protein